MTTTLSDATAREAAQESSTHIPETAVDAASAAQLAAPESTTSANGPPRGPIWRVVGGSVLAGFLGAVASLNDHSPTERPPREHG